MDSSGFGYGHLAGFFFWKRHQKLYLQLITRLLVKMQTILSIVQDVYIDTGCLFVKSTASLARWIYDPTKIEENFINRCFDAKNYKSII